MLKPLFGDVPRANKMHDKHLSVVSVSSSKVKVGWQLILTRLNSFIFFHISLLCTQWKIVNKKFTVSNQLTKVFQILDYFKFLEKSEIKLGALMSFLTGSEKIPTFGLPLQITVSFKHDCQNQGTCRSFPTVNTCSYSVDILVHINNDAMLQAFTRGLSEDIGFGRC